MRKAIQWAWLPILCLLPVCQSRLAAEQPLKTQNVIFVMNDGLRWEEVFRGAEKLLVSAKPGGVKQPPQLKRQFERPTREACREALFPFLWKTIARQGQVFGNLDKGSNVRVTNGHNFSYPGYSETLCGFADPRIRSNDKRLNPNRTVLEWLYRKPRFGGAIAAFGAWDRFPFIFNRERCGLYVNAGFEPMLEGEITPEIALLKQVETGDSIALAERTVRRVDLSDGPRVPAFARTADPLPLVGGKRRMGS
jgi:hypothetical protein